MRIILFVVSFLIFLFTLFLSAANAQTATSTNSSTNSATTFNQQRLDLRQRVKDAIQMKREETKLMVKTKRDEFKAKIETLKDQRKKTLVERIDVKLANVNAKHTDRFTELLSKLQQILDKISAKTTETKVLADIKTAQTAIDSARAAVETQAAKTYTIQITDENALRLNVGAANSQLRKDLMATHKLVVDAKQAVQNLRKDKVMIEKQSTGSANL